jgi:hypothetical protein
MEEGLYSSTHFKYQILDGDGWSVGCADRFNVGKVSAIRILSRLGWPQSQSGHGKGCKILCPCWELRHTSVIV